MGIFKTFLDTFEEGTVAGDVAGTGDGFGRGIQRKSCKHKNKNGTLDDTMDCKSIHESTEGQAALTLANAADECSRRIEVLGSFSERGVMTRDAGFEMEYKGERFQVTVVQTR